MILTHASLILAGIACVSLSSYLLYVAVPRHGRPVPQWTASETRSTLLALGIVTLFVFGGGLVLKGILT